MSRDKQVTFYVSQRKKDRLKREADEADVTVSTLLDSILDQHWADADTDEASERMDTEEKIERVANQAFQEIEATARHTEQRVDDLAEIVARSGSYSVANFELLKYQHGPPEGTKTDALRVGSRRLRAPLSDHPDLLDPDDDVNEELDRLPVVKVAHADSNLSQGQLSERLRRGGGRSLPRTPARQYPHRLRYRHCARSQRHS